MLDFFYTVTYGSDPIEDHMKPQEPDLQGSSLGLHYRFPFGVLGAFNPCLLLAELEKHDACSLVVVIECLLQETG